ncbi:hypothetical protein E6C76_00875 [Pseudothauera nasutitermitis]|uniref:Methyl-accepting chemotaxis protein n=1 Tax=Pseudothauera nasutitermitis TaxID=2565930 RepID=A0A4S4B323_9RHOO|nr:hypothetical protein [Pseudothauera nasutitermitis]THF66979.1 hypothetical protein E6C76_00875 [Pseudothauera nasutitermitis]
MAIELIPIIKAVLPYVAQVATAAIPVFSSKSDKTAKADPVVARQIEELQSAVTQNAESIHVLADNLRRAIQGIEGAAQEARRQAAAYRTMLFVALGLSVASLLIALFLLVR